MPFQFKLSKRLALIKGAIPAVAAVALAACDTQSGLLDPRLTTKVRVVQVITSPSAVTLDPTQTHEFLAFGRTLAGDSLPVSVQWSASVGSITPRGVYVADTIPGDHVVTATLANGTAKGTSRVKNRGLLTQILASPSSASVFVGQTVQFAAQGVRRNGDSVLVKVVFSATGGTVSAAGLYTAGQSAGTYHVIARDSGSTLADTAVVTISSVSVASVTVSPGSAKVVARATLQLSAVMRDSTGTPLAGRVATWATSAPTVATVSASGLVTGVTSGTATVTATSEGKNGTAVITVTDIPVATVAVSPTVASLLVAGALQLSAVPLDSAGKPLTGRLVTWVTSAPAVATVSASGLVTGVAIGATTITATSEGKSGTSVITVTTVPVVASVTVAPASASILVGATQQLSAVTKDSAGTTLTGRVVTWSSGAPTIVSVSSSGLVTGFAPGSATITATSEGKTGSAAVTVNLPPVASVTVSPSGASVSVGATLQLSAVLKDANGNVLTGRGVTWASSVPALATVSSGGLVTGLVIGAVTITATSEGQSGTAPVSVITAGGPQPGPSATIIFQDGFESGSLSLWNEYDAARYSITTNAARVKSGTRSLQALYTPTDAYGFIARWFMPGYDEVYVRFDVMFEEGFENMRPDGYGMHFFALAGNRIDNSRSSLGTAGQQPNGTDFFYAGVDPEQFRNDPTLRPFMFYTYWPDMSCCYGNMIRQVLPKVPLLGGQWQVVVHHIKLNTPGQFNGSQALWVDGVKKIEMQNMRWRTTTDLRLNQIIFQNYMSAAPQTQHIWVDDVMVWRP